MLIAMLVLILSVACEEELDETQLKQSSFVKKTDKNENDVLVKNVGVYLLKASEIKDDQLEDFAMRPSIIKPESMRMPIIPENERPATFNSKDWYFEGFLKPVNSIRAAVRAKKRELISRRV